MSRSPWNFLTAILCVNFLRAGEAATSGAAVAMGV